MENPDFYLNYHYRGSLDEFYFSLMFPSGAYNIVHDPSRVQCFIRMYQDCVDPLHKAAVLRKAMEVMHSIEITYVLDALNLTNEKGDERE